MKIVFLGTSGAQPTEERGMSCVCLQREREILMFDVGEGAQVTYLKSGLGINKPMKIFITHMHGDHCIGILGLLQTMSMQKRTEKIEIFGPKGIDEFIAENIKILKFELVFPIIITTIDERENTIVDEKEYTILICNAKHSIEAYSYVFKEKERPGKFYPEKALKLRVPEGQMWNELQNGHNVTIEGKVIKPEDVLGKKRRGRKIGVSGDTRPTKQLEEFFKECDYLIFDSTFIDGLKDKAIKTCHSTAKEAAMLAKNANVANLILTHFSARYRDEQVLVDEAKKIHKCVMGAHDLLEIDIAEYSNFAKQETT
jgi:ribonuclease Z